MPLVPLKCFLSFFLSFFPPFLLIRAWPIYFFFSFLQVIRVGMFELHCDELIRALAKRAEGLRAKLLQRMSKEHQSLNKRWADIRMTRIPRKQIYSTECVAMVTLATVFIHRLCDEYEKIAEKALTSPANTEHLMELKVLNHRKSFNYRVQSVILKVSHWLVMRLLYKRTQLSWKLIDCPKKWVFFTANSVTCWLLFRFQCWNNVFVFFICRTTLNK